MRKELAESPFARAPVRRDCGLDGLLGTLWFFGDCAVLVGEGRQSDGVDTEGLGGLLIFEPTLGFTMTCGGLLDAVGNMLLEIDLIDVCLASLAVPKLVEGFRGDGDEDCETLG